MRNFLRNLAKSLVWLALFIAATINYSVGRGSVGNQKVKLVAPTQQHQTVVGQDYCFADFRQTKTDKVDNPFVWGWPPGRDHHLYDDS
jgi:hypothetical protein